MADKDWIQWFEIPVYNFDQAKRFYETVFDIQLTTLDLGALTMAVFPPEAGIGSALPGRLVPSFR